MKLADPDYKEINAFVLYLDGHISTLSINDGILDELFPKWKMFINHNNFLYFIETHIPGRRKYKLLQDKKWLKKIRFTETAFYYFWLMDEEYQIRDVAQFTYWSIECKKNNYR